jgi:hypothetical protein
MDIENSVKQFISKISLGVDFFEAAGLMLVDMLDRDPYCFDEIMRSARHSGNAWVTLDVLRTFEQIGRKQLAVQAMFLPRHVLDKVISLPVAEQARLATSPVPVVTGLRHGYHQVERKPLALLTKTEAARTLGPNGLRSPSEQKQITLKAHKEETLGRYTIQIVNNKPFIKHSGSRGPCAKVVVTNLAAIELELVRMVPNA